MIHLSIFKSLTIKSCLLLLLLLPPYSSWAADDAHCTIKGTISFTDFPYWGRNDQIFWFRQTIGTNSYTGGSLNLGVDSMLTLLSQTVSPISSLTPGEVKKLFQDVMSDTTWTREVLVYSNTNSTRNANVALVVFPFYIVDNFIDILGGSDISIRRSSLTLFTSPFYYDIFPLYTYIFGIRINTTDIPTIKNATKSVDYPLSSPICSIPTGTIDTTYQLTLNYSLSNKLSDMDFMASYRGSAPSASNSYQFHAKIEFTRQLNLSIKTVPDTLNFGQIPNAIPSEQNIKININGAPTNSSAQVNYQLLNVPAWADISIMKNSTNITSEFVSAGEDIVRQVKIQPASGATGDIDARLVINVLLN